MTTTTRTTPTGSRLRNGYQCHVAFSQDVDIDLFEVDITPFGITGGDPVDTTTQHNTDVVTRAPRALYDVTNPSFTCGYDPAVLDQILAIVNVEGWITIHFPNDDNWDFYGYLQEFSPDGMSNGDFPMATATIVATNEASGTETVPDFVAAA